MPTLCIRYKINPNRLSDFEAYARNWPKPIERCGGKLIGYFLPTKLAGRTDSAIALIDFPSLATYEEYRRRLMEDPDAKTKCRSGGAVRLYSARGSFVSKMG
jgi:NIPSNAP